MGAPSFFPFAPGFVGLCCFRRSRDKSWIAQSAWRKAHSEEAAKEARTKLDFPTPHPTLSLLCIRRFGAYYPKSDFFFRLDLQAGK
jgi:hypothetical protein